MHCINLKYDGFKPHGYTCHYDLGDRTSLLFTGQDKAYLQRIKCLKDLLSYFYCTFIYFLNLLKQLKVILSHQRVAAKRPRLAALVKLTR